MYKGGPVKTGPAPLLVERLFPIYTAPAFKNYRRSFTDNNATAMSPRNELAENEYTVQHSWCATTYLGSTVTLLM